MIGLVVTQTTIFFRLPVLLSSICFFCCVSSNVNNAWILQNHQVKLHRHTFRFSKKDDFLRWEEEMKDTAATALLPVFFPIVKNNSAATTVSSIYENNNNNNKSNLKNVQSKNSSTITAEKALKRLLRQYQRNFDVANNKNNTTPTERRETRKMLAELVLGTSIMRIRYYYILLAMMENMEFAHTKNHVEPIHGIASSKQQRTFRLESDNGNLLLETRKNITRALVDIHAEYMKGNKEISKDILSTFIANKDESEQLSILYSMPHFFVQLLLEQYGKPVSEQILQVLNEPGPITIRRNAIQCSSDKALCHRLLNDHGITTKPVNIFVFQPKQKNSLALLPTSNAIFQLVPNDRWSPSITSIWSLRTWKDGLFEVQDAGSQLIVRATNVTRGETIVDYCAGNGGKTLALASHLYEQDASSNKEKSRIVAHDIVKDRLRQLEGSLDRIGVIISNPENHSLFPIEVVTTLNKNVTLENDMADVVLVDAPCSSTGVLRRRPSQRYLLKQEEIIHHFPPLQVSILKEAASLVKVGGRLVYATCSICRNENENVVELFEKSLKFETQWTRWSFDKWKENDKSDTLDHCLNILPNKDGSDGFFIARWKRIS